MLALSACAGPPPANWWDPAPGTGWSRAPDLSVYAAMGTAGELAREQEVLCSGRDPARVESRWRAEFGSREAWIAAALTSRYGARAVAQAHGRTVGRERCAPVGKHPWHRQHARMLRLLELRLHPRNSG